MKMVGATAVIALVVCLALSVKAAPPDSELGGNSCDFSDLNVDHAVNQIFTRLPKQREITDPVFLGYGGIFETGRLQATGLDTLQRYGPLQRYCVNGTRVIQFDIVSDGGARLIVPWKSCSGTEGTIKLEAGYSRFTVQLKVEGSGSDVMLQYMGPNLHVATEELLVRFEGVGDRIMAAVGVICKLVDPLVREVWKAQFFRQFNASLQEILPVSVM